MITSSNLNTMFALKILSLKKKFCNYKIEQLAVTTFPMSLKSIYMKVIAEFDIENTLNCQ